MDVLESGAYVLQNEALTQNRLLSDSSALATGLRVRSAADDPSAYAIGQTIQTKVAGLQQSVTNVQIGNNLLNVVDGALTNIQSLLQRIRSLTVEARSDINSSSDLQNIQAEINQLLLEINQISNNVHFNGLTLLNGAFDNRAFSSSEPLGLRQVTTAVAAPNGGTTSDQVSNADGLGNPGPLITLNGQAGTAGSGTFTPAYMIFQVVGYSDNAIDPDTGLDVGPGVYLQFSAYSTSPGFGAAPLYQDTSAVAVNSGPITDVSYAIPATWDATPSAADLIDFNLANLTAADVGATATFVSTQPVATSTSTSALSINDGGEEGHLVGIDIPTVNTISLDISDITVEAPQIVNFMNEVVGQSSSNVVSAGAAQQAVDDALSQVTSIEAYVGAQTVALNVDQTSANQAIVNETAAASNIRDANIGATVTDYTKQQILISVSTAVLSHIETDALQVTALLLDSISAIPAGGTGGTPALASV